MSLLAALAFAQQAQPAAPGAQDDPLVCAAMPDGRPLPLGTPVLDGKGGEIGFVSLAQCSMNPGAGMVRVAVKEGTRYATRVYPLRDAKLDDWSLTVTAAPVAEPARN